MAVYNLNLSSSYCQHWGLWEAIREILQNGEDQFTLDSSNEISVNYNEKTQKLLISNKESILERRTLLLGGTSKADDKKLIGKFGEGYKIALLILTKMGKQTVIKNYKKNEKWTPELKEDSKYDNEEVLKVNIKKYLFKGDRNDNLTWEINGITPSEWESINEKYLRYHDLGNVFTNREGAQILFEEKYKGSVYVNGLFIEKVKSNMAYGYNLTPDAIELDRDRRTVEGVDFFIQTKSILSDYAKKHPEKTDELIEKVESDEPYEDFKYLMDASLYFNSSSEVSDNFASGFKKRYEKENPKPSFPVSNEQEKKAVLAYYPTVTTSIVSKKAKSMLSKTEDYKDIQSFVRLNGGLEKKKTVSPLEAMNMFMDQHMSKVYDQEVVEEFQKLIEESKNWENKPQPEIKEDLNSESSVYSSQLMLDLDSEIIEEAPLIAEIVEEAPLIAEFDDDIPF